MGRLLKQCHIVACALLVCSALRAQEAEPSSGGANGAQQPVLQSQDPIEQTVDRGAQSTESNNGENGASTKSEQSASDRAVEAIRRASRDRSKFDFAKLFGESASQDDSAAATSAAPTEYAALVVGADGDKATSGQGTPLPGGDGAASGMGESFTPDLSSGVGALNIPFAVAPGRQGVAPSLSLSYSTTGGNSLVGFGWSISLPAISRQTDKGMPLYRRSGDGLYHAEEDRFIFGGTELIPVDSSVANAVDGYGMQVPAELSRYQEYRPRLAGDAARFFRAPDESRWIVLNESGSRTEYGRLDDGTGPADVGTWSQDSLVRDPADASRIFRWHLTRFSDVHGSTIYYRYTQDRGQVYPLDIHYLSPALCASASPVRNCAAPLSDYGARVAFDYESRSDAFSSYVSGFRIVTGLRLRRVTMTAAQDQTGRRYLVRRYHLSYQVGPYHSLLASLLREGRPQSYDASAGAMVGNRFFDEASLGDAIVGVTYPAANFEYTKEPDAGPQVAGFGGIDTQVRVANVPDSIPSIGNALAEFVDVNSDGLPDVLVTDPASHHAPDGSPAVGVYFNGFSGSAATPAYGATFSEAVPVGVDARFADVMRFDNPNVAPMDVDGDGRTDLLHMPRRFEYGYFTPTRAADGALAAVSPAAQDWRFTYAHVSLDRSTADPRVDLGSDGAITRTVDVNGDHLVDIVQTAGQSMFTWLNLGFLPDGEGRFGSAAYANGKWQLSTQPIESCLLRWNNKPVDFGERETRLADMNGDGLVDIATVRDNRVVYWPGRGIGLWGDGGTACKREDRSPAPIVMTNPPQGIYEGNLLELEDVNMDGAADFIKVAYDNVQVWYNQAGSGFTKPLTVPRTPAAPAFANNVRMVDIDGSSTTDIVWARGGDYQYVDMMGGHRPRLLTRVYNGIGGLTSLEYASSAEDYLRDLRDAGQCMDSGCDRFTWSEVGQACDESLLQRSGECVHRSGGSPVISNVVRRSITSDQLSLVGQQSNVMVSEYLYHNGYYEGFEQEFRGFGATDTVSLGDDTEPSLYTRSWSYQGRRPSEIASDRLAENPYEGLKGLSYMGEAFDARGVYLSTKHTSHVVRKLFSGLDGRDIVFVYPSQSDEILYDTAPFTASSAALLLPSLRFESASAGGGASIVGTQPDHSIRLRGQRYAHLRSTIDTVDNAAHVLDRTKHGRIRDEIAASVVEPISEHTRYLLVDPSLGIYRANATWVTGYGIDLARDGYDRLSDAVSRYDALGRLVFSSTAAVVGGSWVFRGDGRAEQWTQTTQALVASQRYDAWGNTTATCAGADIAAGASITECLRYAETTFDTSYAQLALSARTAAARQGGSFRFLTSSQTFDRGIGSALSATDPSAQVTMTGFDGFGRTTFLRQPAASATCSATLVPTVRFFYLDPTPTLPVSVVYHYLHTGCTAITDDANILETRSYLDGLGRTRGSLSRSATAQWVRAGTVVFNARGQGVRSYQPSVVAVAQPDVTTSLAIPSTPYTTSVYDAFGRVKSGFDEDGNESRYDYHALSTDASDALDLGGDAVFAGTFSTKRMDGHGQVISSVERNRFLDRPGTEYYQIFTQYRADGAMLSVTRASTASADPAAPRLAQVTRSFGYDSVGRRIATNDLDTNAASGSTWMYLHNRVGDLVAVRDPRGCGQNFYFDFGGRSVGQDYVSCAEAAARADNPSDIAPGDIIGLEPGAGRALDAVHYYDTLPGWATGSLAPSVTFSQGRATALVERAQRTVLGYNARGLVNFTARQLAFIPVASTAAASLTAPPQLQTETANAPVARSFDQTSTYIESTSFDHGGRAYETVLPRAPDWNDSGALGPTVSARMYFDARGLPRRAETVIGGVVRPVISDIRYTASGQEDQITYGDDRGGTRTATRTNFTYDSRLRIRTSTTLRAATEFDFFGGRPLGAVTKPFAQVYTWDAVSNLKEVRDERLPMEWPAAYRPQRVRIFHDAMYRVANAQFSYLQDGGAWGVSDTATDWRSELTRLNDDFGLHVNADPMRGRPAANVSSAGTNRVVDLTWDWDWLANMTEWTDDSNLFYERSIGRITNGYESSGRPSALYLASNLRTTSPGTGTPANILGGYVELDYGSSGNVVAVTVHGNCHDVSTTTTCYDPSSSALATRRATLASRCRCDNEQHYQYRWDELNRLSDARRYNRSGGTGSYQLAARVRHLYGADNQRVVKHVIGFAGDSDRYALTVFDGDFERRGLTRGVSGYEHSVSMGTENQYLVFGARINWEREATFAGSTTLDRDARIVMPLADLLNTTSAAIDLLSGDLLEYSTYYPNGARETFRSQRRVSVTPEATGFTGKEADEEVGLTYFGERYLITRVARWATPDPLAVHAVGGGEALNSYHYVSGNLLQARDPLGLCGDHSLAAWGECAGVFAPLGYAVDNTLGSLARLGSETQARVVQRTGSQAAGALMGAASVVAGVFGHETVFEVGNAADEVQKAGMGGGNGWRLALSLLGTNAGSKVSKGAAGAALNGWRKLASKVQWGGAREVGSSKRLREAMEAVLGVSTQAKGAGKNQAHHLIPKKFSQHDVLKKAGMDIDAATNGVLLPEMPCPNCLPNHLGDHPAFTEAVGNQLDALRGRSTDATRSGILDLQENILGGLEAGLPLTRAQAEYVGVSPESVGRLWNDWLSGNHDGVAKTLGASSKAAK